MLNREIILTSQLVWDEPFSAVKQPFREVYIGGLKQSHPSSSDRTLAETSRLNNKTCLVRLNSRRFHNLQIDRD